MAQINLKRVIIIPSGFVGGERLGIQRMLQESDLKAGEERDPHTIYIPNVSTEERDIALASFMDAWGELELVKGSLLQLALGAKFSVTRIIDVNSESFARSLELILALSRATFNDTEQAELKNICERIKRYNTKRNRIIHGHWWLIIYVQNFHGTVHIENSKWIRKYSPSDPKEEQKLNDPTNQKIQDACVYSVERLEKTTNEVLELASAGVGFSEQSVLGFIPKGCLHSADKHTFDDRMRIRLRSPVTKLFPNLQRLFLRRPNAAPFHIGGLCDSRSQHDESTET